MSGPFATWFASRIVVDDSAATTTAVLYQDYAAWMADHGLSGVMSRTAFGKLLDDRNLPRERVQDPTGQYFEIRWRGARLEPTRRPTIRLVRAVEQSPGAKLAASVLRRVTGGPPYPVRNLMRRAFAFVPKGLVTIAFRRRRPEPRP